MKHAVLLPFIILILISCNSKSKQLSDVEETTLSKIIKVGDEMIDPISAPLVSHIYTADPSAHVFEGKLYIYPSHDIDAGIPEDDEGGHFGMKDYHVFSMDRPGGEVTDHGVALDIADVPWAGRQMWAPDAAYANGQYYLYFPVKDKNDVFAIGVAISDRPEGPFKAEPNKIEGTYSMDPTAFKDSDGEYYLYFGGIWGGQLERWQTGEYNANPEPVADDADAIAPRIAKLNSDMISLAESPRKILILDEEGETIKAGDHDRRFFEASWVHKYNDKYYFSYSTGDTHFINYAIGDNPYGPFTYKGVILDPVIGWTNHHSIVEFEGQWYLFYHDSTLSGGVTHLRNIKMTPLTHNQDGTIQRINPYISRNPV